MDYSQHTNYRNPNDPIQQHPTISNTVVSHVNPTLPPTAPINVSPPIVWTFHTKPPATPTEPPQKRGRGRPAGSKNKPRAPGEKRTAKGLYDPVKRADAEVKLKKWLANDALPCRQGRNGSVETLSVIGGAFHRSCGVSKVPPRTFVLILTDWAKSLPEPWLLEKKCPPADSWWKNVAIASLDIFGSLITDVRRNGGKLGGNPESRMFRIVSIIEVWHYLGFHDSASSYWRRRVIEQESPKSPTNHFETLRRDLVLNSERLGSFLRNILEIHFAESFGKVLATPGRRIGLEGRIGVLESHECSGSIVSCSSSVGSDVVSSIPCVPPAGGLISHHEKERTNKNHDKPISAVTGLAEQTRIQEHQNKEQTSNISDVSIPYIVMWINRSRRTIIHDEYGFELVESDDAPTRLPDGSLNLLNPDVFIHVITSPFLPMTNYPISFACSARWSNRTLKVQPGASALIQGEMETESQWFSEFIQKESCYNICAAPLSQAIGLIRHDESIKAKTAYVREQYRIEREDFGSRECHAKDWQRRILYALADEGEIAEEKKHYRKLAETLSENIKCSLPSIMPSGWIVPRDQWVKGHFRKNCRIIEDEGMIPNGIVCVDCDWLYDSLPTVKKRLIESGLCSLVGTSARGIGLYAMIRYDKNRYRGSSGFHAAREAVWAAVRRMGLKPDTTCKNISRHRFLAHDPELWLDESDTARLP